MSELIRLDVEVLKELKEVMEDEFDTLIETYVNDSMGRVKSIKEALEEQRFEDIAKAAHSFKGSCGNIGAPFLADLCRQVEEAGRNQNLDVLESLVAKVTDEFQEVKTMITGFASS